MATNTSKVFIDIITEFTGNAQLKQANKSFDALTKTVRRFVSVYAIERLIRSSTDAFMEQQSALAGYNNTLNNLGTSYASLQPLIDQTTQSFIALGFEDTQTIMALNKLTVALGNPAKALDVLATTADLARFKNKSLSETAGLVAKAIAGNSRAFADLGLKIDKNLEPQAAFNKLLDEAKKKAGGAAEVYSKTLAGSLDIAKAKADNASESLGEKLAPSIKKLTDYGVKYLLPLFTTIANNIGPIIAMASALGAVALALRGVALASALATGALSVNPLFAIATGAVLAPVAAKGFAKFLKGVGQGIKNFALGAAGSSIGVNIIPKTSTPIKETKKLTEAEKLLARYRKEWQAASLKAAKALTKAEADKLKLEKASAVLRQAAKVMDIDQAQILAALGRDISKEDSDRLKLQQALLNENADAAGKLAQTVLAANEAALLAEQNNPFGSWDSGLQLVLKNVRLLQKELAALGSPEAPLPNAAKLLADDAAAAAADAFNTEYEDVNAATKNFLGGTAAPSYADDFMRRNRSTGQYDTAFQNAIVNVMLNPKDLTAAVTSGQQDTTASGIIVGTSRINKYPAGS